MRIESSAFSRNMISSLPQQQQAQKGNGAEVQKQKQVDTQQQNKPQSVQSTKVKAFDVDLQNLPKTLDEVIEPEEKSMLQELFPGSGSKWGVDAYKMNNTVSNSYSVGAKLDLTT